MKRKTKGIILLLLLCAGTWVAAQQVTPPVTSAKLVGSINAVMYGASPACYAGPIECTFGVWDFDKDEFGYLTMLPDVYKEDANWCDPVRLAPSMPGLSYSEERTLQGADVPSLIEVMVDNPDTVFRYEFDITTLVQWIVANNSTHRPYGFVFLGHGDTGKINCPFFETGETAKNLKFEITDATGTHVFQYNRALRDSNIFSRISYSGHFCQHNLWNDDGFAIGGHKGGPDYMEGMVEDQCSGVFHRGLASFLGWNDPEYTAVEKTPLKGSKGFTLSSAPNPFGGKTTLRYGLTTDGAVNLSVYNLQGQKVSTLVSGQQTRGAHQVQWNGTDSKGNRLPYGVYLCRLQAGNREISKRLVMMP